MRESKTDAGVAYVDLLPPLRDELTALKMRLAEPDPRALVFPSAVGTRQDRNRVRTRVLVPAIARANELLEDQGLAPLPDGLTLHALRRTFASLLAVVPGNDTPYIISQVRHTDPGVTYCYYAKAVRPEHRRALIALVKGDYLALTGTGALNGTRAGAESVAWEKAETAD